MLRFLKGFFKPKYPDVTPKPEAVAPYKVEPPVVEEAPKLTVDGHGDVHEVKTTPKPKKSPAKKKPTTTKAPAKPKTTKKTKTK